MTLLWANAAGAILPTSVSLVGIALQLRRMRARERRWARLECAEASASPLIDDLAVETAAVAQVGPPAANWDELKRRYGYV